MGPTSDGLSDLVNKVVDSICNFSEVFKRYALCSVIFQ